LPRTRADALDRESGRIHTLALLERRDVRRDGPDGLLLNGRPIGTSPSFLHLASLEAIRRVAERLTRKSRQPRLRRWGASLWPRACLRRRGTELHLALGRGHAPVRVLLPPDLSAILSEGAFFLEMRLVWDAPARKYWWHAVIDDGRLAPPPGQGVIGADLGDIHPVAATDGEAAAIFCAQDLRSTVRYRNQRLRQLKIKQALKQTGSGRWRRLERRKQKFLAHQKRLANDIAHKVSRAVVDWAVDRRAGTLAVGDVGQTRSRRPVNTSAEMAPARWTQGRVFDCPEYKARAAGLQVVLVNEDNTSQACPACGRANKPWGR